MNTDALTEMAAPEERKAIDRIRFALKMHAKRVGVTVWPHDAALLLQAFDRLAVDALPAFDPDECNCAASQMPPCAYCESGGYNPDKPIAQRAAMVASCSNCERIRAEHVAAVERANAAARSAHLESASLRSTIEELQREAKESQAERARLLDELARVKTATGYRPAAEMPRGMLEPD